MHIIKKLLNLANDPGATEAEAAAALEKATAMMIKLGIDRPPDDEMLIREGDNFVIVDKWQQVIAMAASTLYGVIPVMSTDHKSCCFVGRDDNISAASDTFSFLLDQVNRSYKAHLPPGLSTTERANFRRTFKLSAAMRVLSRAQLIIKQFEQNGTSDCTALVVRHHNVALREEAVAFAQNNMKTVERTTKLSVRPTEGARMGRKAGDNIDLNRTVGA